MLEARQCEVTDEIYNSYCELISKENIEQKSHYRHYVLPPCSPIPRIVLQESTCLLSSGTTGLSSWQV
ncbi:hypothetical protein B566_EDAN001382 [Ephemera danica]|nr:hypothetical protein B566_EDAN001382 [Ephemera danica]